MSKWVPFGTSFYCYNYLWINWFLSQTRNQLEMSFGPTIGHIRHIRFELDILYIQVLKAWVSSLCRKKVSFSTLNTIVSFVFNGEVSYSLALTANNPLIKPKFDLILSFNCVFYKIGVVCNVCTDNHFWQ